ncbi:MAG: hypothetical protein IT371_30500 [Deltaproteobacteria bacterium]|nr:hypothetical protein [Deltaproteobacteria bacterium]
MSYYGLGALGAAPKTSPVNAGVAAMQRVAGNVASRAISRVTIRSQITPDYSVDPSAAGPSAAPKQGFGNVLMGLIRPAIYVETPAGTIRVEPWGQPRSNYLPVILALGGVAALAVFGGVYLLGRRSR